MSNVALPPVNPSAYSLVASNKGDISNRAKCASAQFVNQSKGLAGIALVGAGATAAAYGLSKSLPAASVVAKVADKILSKLPSCQVVNKLLCETPKTKAIGLVIALAAPVLGYIATKTVFKAGQIDQKYTDRAIWEEKTKAVFDV